MLRISRGKHLTGQAEGDFFRFFYTFTFTFLLKEYINKKNLGGSGCLSFISLHTDNHSVYDLRLSQM